MNKIKLSNIFNSIKLVVYSLFTIIAYSPFFIIIYNYTNFHLFNKFIITLLMPFMLIILFLGFFLSYFYIKLYTERHAVNTILDFLSFLLDWFNLDNSIISFIFIKIVNCYLIYNKVNKLEYNNFIFYANCHNKLCEITLNNHNLSLYNISNCNLDLETLKNQIIKISLNQNLAKEIIKYLD